jgi:hypothetical protein
MLVDLQFQPLKTLAKAKIRPVDGLLSFYPTLADALLVLDKRTAELCSNESISNDSAMPSLSAFGRD